MEGEALKGHLHVIRFLHEVVGKDLTTQAFLNGIESFKLTQYFLKRGGYDRWSYSVMDKACGVSLEHVLLFHGHPASVQWVLQNHANCLSFEAVLNAAGRKNLDLLHLVLEKVELNSRQRRAVVEPAISREDLTAVKYLYDRWPSSFKVNEEFLWEQRDYDLAKYLHKHAGILMASAVKHGRLEVFFFLYKRNRHLSSPDMLNLAAKRGHLPIVQFLHEQGDGRRSA